MVTSPAQGKRRFSDQTLAMNINASSEFEDLASRKRRQTIGGDVRPRPSSALVANVTVMPTPTKRKVNLGSTAASGYYFSGIPKTPLSTSKPVVTEGGKTFENPFSDSDDSTQSFGNNDIMNKSVLSDTTELTASNFVRVASSRMQVSSFTEDTCKYALQSESFARSVVGNRTQDSSGGMTGSSSQGEVSTSPRGLRKFTRTLEQSRLQSDDGCETPSIGPPNLSGNVPSFTSPVSKVSDDCIQKNSTPRDLDVSLSSLDDLFDGLLATARMASPESSLLASPRSCTDRSRLLEASIPSNKAGGTMAHSFSSPGISPINGDHVDEPFRLTLSKPSTKLTPTRLNRSPRRVLNLNSADSPARNTRSTSKNTSIDQLGIAHGIDETGALLGPCIPSPDITSTSSPSRIFAMDDEEYPGNEITNTAKDSSALDDSKRRRSESGYLGSDHLGGPGKKSKGSNFLVERRPSAGSRIFQASNSECALAPKSILNSTKKKQNASDNLRRKTVAFGSPEAAEYHIGSPSVSLTPMPSNRAKAMFSIPSALSIADSNSSVASDSVDSAVLNDGTLTVDIELNVNQMLENAADYLESDSRRMHVIDASGATSALFESNAFVDRPSQKKLDTSPSAAVLIDVSCDQMRVEDETKATDSRRLISRGTKPFELKSPVRLLEASSASVRSCGGLNESQPHTSDAFIGTTTSESSVLTEALANNASMDFKNVNTLDSVASTVEALASPPLHSIDVSINEDDTVELEADLSAILAMASQGSDGYDSLPSLRLADRFPKATSTLVPTTFRLSFGHAVPTQTREDLTPGRTDFWHSESPAPTSTHSRRRRSDSSRRRFSLTRTGRLSIASEGGLLDLSRLDSAGDDEETEADPPLKVDESEDHEEQFTISCEELGQLVGPGGCLPTTNLNSGFQSSVQSLFAEENARYSQVSDSILSFATAVCGEVEGKAHLNSDSEACFLDLVETIGGEKVRLQRWLRNPTGQYETKSIANAIRRIVDHEWSGWEKIVLESLTAAIAQIGAELEPESCQLEGCMTALYHLHDLLSISAGKVASRARRRSMARHESNAVHLALEVHELERKLCELDVQASYFAGLLGDAATVKAATQRRILAQNNFHTAKRVAENSQCKVISLKGLSRVAPFSVGCSNLTLQHVGYYPSSSLTSSLYFRDGLSFQCNSPCADFPFVSKGQREKLSNHALTFMESRCSELSAALSVKELRTAEEIRCLVRQIEWTRGRIESTAQELTALQKRFNLSLETDLDGGVSEFLVKISFEGTGEDCGLVTTFELNASYPFGPLSVSLEPGNSDVNLGQLQKHLTKNAKPGFRYLSRACDVIAAVVQSTL